jgi:hypothetical protein
VFDFIHKRGCLIIKIQSTIQNELAMTFVSLSGFLYSTFECCRVLWNPAECRGMHWSSTYSIIVICTGYKYYVLEEDSNAIVLNYVVFLIVDAITYVCRLMAALHV